MEAIIEYGESQEAIIEKVLEDHLNEGWSEKSGENGMTVAGIDVPVEKLNELTQHGITVNTESPKLVNLVYKALEEKPNDGSETFFTRVDGIDVRDDNKAWGGIDVRDGRAYFQQGNDEPSISLDSERLMDWIRAYLKGVDEFDEVVAATSN